MVNNKAQRRLSQPSALYQGAQALLLGSVIFLGAFLVFQVQPLIGKAILPWFGGSAAVWTACLLFFQAALLLGYLYAHALVRYLGQKWQGIIHCSLLVASLLALPIIPDPKWKPTGSADPLLHILRLLFSTVGIPYILLSATSPLLQSWVSRRPGSNSPYRLFSLSNFGSLIGLLAFPLLVEPNLDGFQQAFSWSWAYAVFTVLCCAVAWSYRSTESSLVSLPSSGASSSSWSQLFTWAAFAAGGSALLLAVSHHLTQDIVSIPLLWVIPLALYLISFILVFAGTRLYPRAMVLPLFAGAIIAMAYLLFVNSDEDGVWIPYQGDYRILVLVFCSALFFCCWALHGELARRKPPSANLTSYYLSIAAGGAVGALLVAWLAPRIFPAPWEMPLLLVVCPALVLTFWERPNTAPGRLGWVLAAMAIFSVGGYVGWQTYQEDSKMRRMTRNFYGSLRVLDRDRGLSSETRRMDNGTTIHGEQFLRADARRTPTTYYGRGSGIGIAVQLKQSRGPISLGVVGLGIGTIAAFAKPEDHVRFYEINEQVPRLALEEFFFLKDSRATINIAMGDARLSLEREQPQNFDVLAIDAFSSDAIPVHLLTQEAFTLYGRHLKPTGLLALHLSNRHLLLERIAYTGLRDLGWGTIRIVNPPVSGENVLSANWLLASRVPGYFSQAAFERTGSPIDAENNLKPWTDRYSSIWPILR